MSESIARIGGYALGAVATAATFTGCLEPLSNAPFEEDILFLEALPQSEQLEVMAPDDTSAARVSEAAASQGCGVASSCDPDGMRRFTYETVEGVNGYVFNVLTTLDRIRSNPPSERTQDSRIWGPAEVEPDVWIRLEVTRDAPVFSYELTLGSTPAADEAVMLSGYFVPGSTAMEGEGAFIFDVTVQSEWLDDGTHTGQLDVVYGTFGESVDLSVVARAMGMVGTTPQDEEYAYYSEGAADGLFYFHKPVDAYVTGEDSRLEQAFIWSAWDSQGAGRADVRIMGGDLGDTVGQITECWDAQQQWTWYTSPGCTPQGSADTCKPSEPVIGWNQSE